MSRRGDFFVLKWVREWTTLPAVIRDVRADRRHGRSTAVRGCQRVAQAIEAGLDELFQLLDHRAGFPLR
jgi:hypothetical protein